MLIAFYDFFQMYNLHQDDEDDEMALRLAALKTLRRKDVPVPKPTPNVSFFLIV